MNIDAVYEAPIKVAGKALYKRWIETMRSGRVRQIRFDAARVVHEGLQEGECEVAYCANGLMNAIAFDVLCKTDETSICICEHRSWSETALAMLQELIPDPEKRPDHGGFKLRLLSMNDSQGKSFPEIADEIQAWLEDRAGEPIPLV